MLQVFYIDVVKADLDVALLYLLQVFYLDVAIVLSGCCIC